jgi:hypothetical protein
MLGTQEVVSRPHVYYRPRGPEKQAHDALVHASGCPTCLRPLQMMSTEAPAYAPRACLSCDVHWRTATQRFMHRWNLPEQQSWLHCWYVLPRLSPSHAMLWRRMLSYLPRWRLKHVCYRAEAESTSTSSSDHVMLAEHQLVERMSHAPLLWGGDLLWSPSRTSQVCQVVTLDTPVLSGTTHRVLWSHDFQLSGTDPPAIPLGMQKGTPLVMLCPGYRYHVEATWEWHTTRVEPTASHTCHMRPGPVIHVGTQIPSGYRCLPTSMAERVAPTHQHINEQDGPKQWFLLPTQSFATPLTPLWMDDMQREDMVRHTTSIVQLHYRPQEQRCYLVLIPYVTANMRDMVYTFLHHVHQWLSAFADTSSTKDESVSAASLHQC